MNDRSLQLGVQEGRAQTWPCLAHPGGTVGAAGETGCVVVSSWTLKPDFQG